MKAARPVFVDRGEDADALNESNADPSSADSQSSETRTREQQRHDVLGAILDAAGRVADAPHLAGAPPAILVTVTKEALDQGSGVGVIDGMDTPVSVETVAQLADTGGSQPVTLDATGALLSMGSVQRCFTPSQRRAITVRDGGCLIPGCPIPAGWCEVHHVIPYRAGGATHVHNGVLLCWWHHHIIDSGPWRLRMHRGVPQVRGPGVRDWTVATKRRIDPPPINAPCRGPDPGRRGLHSPPGSVPSPQDHRGP
ncbi:HNH endonuclease [Labedella gwakjiensis]|uniref:HNH endonuclease n=1 Tax=Labedella gwakjiensis TaxID=390269 RepID=A0A2P8GY46_9MICO|nr:HNH endonuclease signature motif containing protein [Labedella gwakjiensis]PSL38889.1 HNH endonuclease [Labedella gwakjiensis]RUQ86643.1 HNH endonuclease [Labedella gwakjiensis]